MKRTILFRHLYMAALMALCAMPALAQLNGSGYYRFRNAERTTEYISITNDKFNYWTIMDDAGGGLSTLYNDDAAQQRAVKCSICFLQNDIHMVEDPDIIDLASVIYAQKGPQSNYNLIGQGTSLLTLTTGIYKGTFLIPISLNFKELYVSLSPVDEVDGLTRYTASMPLKASNIDYADLGIRYFVDEGGKFDNDEYSSQAATPTKARWYIEQVPYFNVKPEVGLNGKWYTSLKVPFAFTLSGSVERAYAITDNSLNSSVVAEAGGTVPAGTPVILQCSSPNAADCQLIPTGTPVFTEPTLSQHTATAGVPAATDVIAPTADNLLIGTYFCNTDGTLTYPKSSGNGTLDGNHYQGVSGKYVIGKDDDGKLGFIDATGTAMPANKAWLTSGGLFPSVTTPTISHATGTYAGTQNVTITCDDTEATILYSTDGTTWTEYTGDAIPVEETTTISAKAIKAGLYNDSEVATSTITIVTPVITVTPESLTINDENGDTKTGTLTATVEPAADITATTSTSMWGVDGNTITYWGRALHETGSVTYSSNGAEAVTAQLEYNYTGPLYILGTVNNSGWAPNNYVEMTKDNDGFYSAEVTASEISFTKRVAEYSDQGSWDYIYNYRFVPVSNGAWGLTEETLGGWHNLDFDPAHVDAQKIVMPAGTYTVTIDPINNKFKIDRVQNVLLGDVNEDGEVTIKDVTDLIDYLLGSEVDPFNFTNADVSQDNEISIKDVTDLIDILLGM